MDLPSRCLDLSGIRPGSTRTTFRSGVGPPGGLQPGVGAGPAQEKGSGRPVPPRAGESASSEPGCVAPRVPGGEAEVLLTRPYAPGSDAEQQRRALPNPNSPTLNSSLGPSAEWKAPEMGASLRAQLAVPTSAAQLVASPVAGPYQLFGRLLLGFSKQPHGELNSSHPFRLSVPCAQAGHGQPPGRGCEEGNQTPREGRGGSRGSTHARSAGAELSWVGFYYLDDTIAQDKGS